MAALLAAEFNVSEDAIRRDLRALAAAGRCRRTYGGALPVSPASRPMIERVDANGTRKRALARAAAELVQPGEVVFLDNGSTNLALATALPVLPGLTIATNAVLIAAELLRRGHPRVIMIGGSVDPDVGGCIDAHAVADVQRLRPDRCFLGACAVSSRDGFAAFEYGDAVFKREILARSHAATVLATTDKLETGAPHAVADLSDVTDLVIEHDAPVDVRAALTAAGSHLLVADQPD